MKITDCIGEKQAEKISGPIEKGALMGLIVRPEEEPEVAEIRARDIPGIIDAINYMKYAEFGKFNGEMALCGFEHGSCLYYYKYGPDYVKNAPVNRIINGFAIHGNFVVLGLEEVYVDGNLPRVQVVSLTQGQADRYCGMLSIANYERLQFNVSFLDRPNLV